jgi:hypothetical protein
MATIRNTSGDGAGPGHVIHLAYLLPKREGSDQPQVGYVTLPGMKAPGIPPSESPYEIDDLTVSKLLAHKPNEIFIGSQIVIGGLRSAATSSTDEVRRKIEEAKKRV